MHGLGRVAIPIFMDGGHPENLIWFLMSTDNKSLTEGKLNEKNAGKIFIKDWRTDRETKLF